MKEMRQKRSDRGHGRGYQWLLAHVEYSGNDCLMWPFSKNNHKGYGQFGLNGKVLRPHRVMCEIVNGPAPSPKHQAAHTCGKGGAGCVHPSHLAWKTPSENQRDRRKHGTATARHYGSCRLTLDQVEEIRAAKGRESAIHVAPRFGVSAKSVENIWGGRTWTGPHFRQRRTQMGNKP